VVLDQAGQANRDDEEEADRHRQRKRDRQRPGQSADLLRFLALLLGNELRIGGDAERPEADLQRFAESDDPADHGKPENAVALRPGDDRLGRD